MQAHAEVRPVATAARRLQLSPMGSLLREYVKVAGLATEVYRWRALSGACVLAAQLSAHSRESLGLNELSSRRGAAAPDLHLPREPR